MGLIRAGIAALAIAVCACLPAGAETRAERLGEALLLQEVVDILRQEGLAYGRSLDTDLLAGAGGRYFAAQVARFYDSGAMLEVLNDSIAEHMSDKAIADSLAFFDSEEGRRILQFEVSARIAMSDPAVEDAALAAFQAALDKGDPRAEDVVRFIEINDLAERNVAGALSSNYRFFLGLVDGGGRKMSEAEIIDEVWGQEDEIRVQTGTWLNSFLYLAYQPLSDEVMRAYLDYSDTAAGQALNTALFDGFDEMYHAIYYALGRAVAQAMQASEL